MKKGIITIVAMFIVILSSAQIEVKINPVGALFGSPSLSGEYIASDNFGAELTLGLISGKAGKVDLGLDDSNPRKSGFGVMAMGKYYFSPDYGCDKFFTGIYLRQKSFKVDDKDKEDFIGYKRSILGTGLVVGYKWVGDAGITLELALGLGRAIVEKSEWIDPDEVLSDIPFPKIGIDGIGRLALDIDSNKI